MKHKPYPKYKPSGIDWIGDILENGFSKEEKITFFEAPSRARRIVKEGDTIVSTVRTYLKAIAYIDDSESELIASTGFAVFRPEDEIDRKYLYYSLCSERVILTISAISVGVSYPAINASDLACIFLIFPNKAEQKKIADFLDHKTAQIDDLIQKKEEMIKLLKEKRAAIINHAVTKGLDPNAKMKPSGIDWIGDIPDGWKIERLKYWVGLINEPEESEDEKFLVDLDNIENFTGKLLNETEGSGKGMKMFATGDVLLNKLRPYLAKVFYGGKYGCCGGELLVLRPKDKIVPKFLFYRVLSIDFINLINNSSYGVKMPRANWDYIGSVFLPYSNKQEQQAIVRYLDSKTEEIDSLIKKIESAIAKLREYRSSLITAAVTGKIDVRGAVKC